MEAARLPLTKEKVSLRSLIADSVGDGSEPAAWPWPLPPDGLPSDIPVIYADPTRIRQVLLNLLNNAARFTEVGGITVRAAVGQEQVQISVEDTGVGIPSEQLRDVFGEFHQVDASLRRRHGGTGLGLSICKQFISLHEGRIWAESEVGKGSTFHFTLPLPSALVVPRQQSRVAPGWRYPASRPEAPRRVVTLESPLQFRRILSRYLTGIQVVAVNRPAPDALAAAVRRTQSRRRGTATGSLSQTAIEGPGERVPAPAVPVVVFSLPLEEHLALAEGFSHCLMKPFSARRRAVAHTGGGGPRRQDRYSFVDDDPGVMRLVERFLSAANGWQSWRPMTGRRPWHSSIALRTCYCWT